ncbi:MAG: phenylalanine--tRNA ligase subunit beta [Planctomycetes bacterium]|nr:phenylalanine--tRNA ligase subunit beta [Planctomycetota bacterium]
MNISYAWLNDLIDSGLSVAELSDKLNAVGCAVEAVEKMENGDSCLVAEITSNRGDWLGHYGIAREVAAITGKPVRFPEITLTENSADIDSLASVKVECPDLCPRYTARVIKGVKVGESPEWLKNRLISVGLRPINNIVDVTNFILYEANQPLHAFDYDRLAGRQIVVRKAKKGEKFQTLTEVDCVLDDDMMVIADAQKPVAIAGVMGGANSEVTARTVNVLLEAACFAPASIRRTANRLKLTSDSSYRYERGIDIAAVERVSARAAQLIAEVAGGEVHGVIDVYPSPQPLKEIRLRYAVCDATLGCHVASDEIGAIFAGLGLEKVTADAKSITVRVPAFRRDLEREIDLIEEVIRLAGFDRVPEGKWTMSLHPMPEAPVFAHARVARQALARLGYHELVTDAFVPEKWEDAANAVAIENPIDSSRPYLRQSLIPSLLDRRRANRAEKDLALFELNCVYGDQPRTETEMLGLLDDRGTEYLRGAIEEMARALRLVGKPVSVRPAHDGPFFAPGSAAEILLNGEKIGTMGLAAPAQCKLHDLENAPAVGEIDFAKLSAAPASERVFSPLPRFPGIRRDLALVVPESVKWEDIAAIAKGCDDIDYGVESVYRGKGVPEGKKSVAFTFTYAAPDRSLTDEEANAKRDALLQALLAKIPGSALR